MDSDYDDNDLYQVEIMSLEESIEKLEWCKCAFECKHKISFGILNRNYMTRIHHKYVNKIAVSNLLHYIINPPKRVKL